MTDLLVHERHATRHKLAASAGGALLFIQIIASELDYGRVGLTSDGIDTVRWLILAVSLVLPAAWATVNGDLIAALSSTAGRWFTVFWIFAILSTIWSIDPKTTAINSVLMSAAFAAGAVGVTRLGSAITIRVSLAAGVTLLISSFVIEIAGNADRWSGVSDSPTSLARTGTFVVVLTMLAPSDRPFVPFRIALIGLGVFAILASGSRMTLLISAVVVATLLVIRAPRAHLRLVLTGGLITGAALIGSGWALFSQLATRAETDTELTEFNGRTSIWDVGFDRVLERPLVGHGFSSGGHLWADLVQTGDLRWYAIHAHQQFLEVALGLGIVGLVVLLGGLTSTARATSASDTLVARTLIATITAIGLTEANLEVESLLLVMLGIAVGAAGRRREAGHHGPD